jgi:NADH:ubiquinone oxidoreductase subunit F (NADH-binding)/(2Fe-2S) ferredoxin/NAD-dependent dihydropyrimidine dehydrogenase PreA subunit
MTNKIVQDSYEKLFQQAMDEVKLREEKSKIRIQVGSATCENAAGAREVFDEFRKHIETSGRQDISLHQTGCTGRCSCEPVVSVQILHQMPVKYEHVNRELAHKIFSQHILGGQPVIENIIDSKDGIFTKWEFMFCNSARCGRDLLPNFQNDLANKLEQAGLTKEQYKVISANCFGLCPQKAAGKAIYMMIRPSKTIYRITQIEHIDRIIQEHILGGNEVKDLAVKTKPMSHKFFNLYGDVSFFSRQTRIALRNNGLIDPEDIYEYITCDGFKALSDVLSKGNKEWIIEQVAKSKLRGRGGGGYPTAQKWEFVAKSAENTRYLICNADEGDPGAFMDRSMLEGDPFSVIEGMIICAYALSSNRGFVYIRAEYPMAIERLEKAVALCRQYGLLGKNILNSGFDFDLELRLGAGAFVCGEETALIRSIEGERGQPRPRPPYPAEKGLWGKPTIINNVETFANVPAIFLYSPEWFASLGTAKSGGTKVFALAGKVKHTGLVEVPMGTTLREIVYEIGGGIAGGKKFKAIQTGGPAGGCIPEQYLDTIVDFDSLTALGSIMGSGGMIIMDEDDCMVDIAKFFLTFSQDESCGKCTPCREGTKRMLEIIERITAGQGTSEDIVKLERLGHLLRKTSLCGLGRAAPNPVLSTLKYFRDEYEAHVHEKRCPSRKCTALSRYNIIPEKCIGCTACARNCPVFCISGTAKHVHVIDQSRCIKCGKCYQVCRFEAVNRT